jgi:hypothetical protein
MRCNPDVRVVFGVLAEELSSGSNANLLEKTVVTLDIIHSVIHGKKGGKKRLWDLWTGREDFGLALKRTITRRRREGSLVSATA